MLTHVKRQSQGDFRLSERNRMEGIKNNILNVVVATVLGIVLGYLLGKSSNEDYELYSFADNLTEL